VTFRDSSCTGKVRYPSKSQAKLAKKRLRTVSGGKPITLAVYSCVYCHGFHMGGTGRHVPMFDLDEIMMFQC
jgi:hypothetical protein